MNEVRLDKEQQNIVIAQAVHIMQQRTLGNVRSLHISDVDQEFLALQRDDVGKKFPKVKKDDKPEERRRIANMGPENLDVISVSRAIEESVRNLIGSTRPDILKPYISRASLLVLGGKVIDFLSGKDTEKIKLPSRIASSIQTNMISMEEEVSHLEALVREKIIALKGAEVPKAKDVLTGEINQLLIQIEELNKELLILSEKYDFSSLLEIQPDSHDEDESEELNFFDEGGGLMERDEPPGDNLTYEENIGLSSSEQHLLGYLPEALKKSETLLDDSFFWFTEGEEWQRSTFHIRDFPDKYREMLEKMLHRKQIIAFYAQHTLEKEEAARATGKQKFSGPGLGKIRKYLPQLEEEIEDIIAKIQSMPSPEEDDGDMGEISETEKTQRSLEESLDYLYGRYETSLYTYSQLGKIEKERLIADIRKIGEDIVKTYRDLSYHCQKHNLTSQHLITISEGEEFDDDARGAISIDVYLDNPDFFENFPDILITQKSDSEKNLLVLCDVMIEKEFLPTVLEGNKVHMFYEEDDGSESSPLEKMKILEEVLQIVLRRKMIIYFECSEKIRACPHPDAQDHLYALQQEIESMQRSVSMLSNRIQWQEEPESMSSDIESEIRHLSQDRFHFLYSFLDIAEPMSRQIIGQKILQLCLALEKRRNILFDADKEREIPEGHIPVEGLSYSESRLLRYVFPDIREGEKQLFAKNTPFATHPGKSGRENKLDMEKARLSQLSERKTIIYFFAMKRLDEIDIEVHSLSQGDDRETLVAERKEIEQYLNQLREETRPFLQELQRVNESPVPRQEAQQKLYYQDLYNEAMKVLGSLDGMIAHTEGSHQKMVRDYWEKIQRQILRFSDRIKIEESKGNLHKIPALQDEFDTEMVQIIRDVEQYLRKILERQGHKGDEPDILAREIHRIRERLFGKPETH